MLRNALMACMVLGWSAPVLLPSVAAGDAIEYSCVYHPEWPVRKYDCTGEGIGDTRFLCTVHWTDDDNNDDWEDYLSRVISSSCTSAEWQATCNESPPGSLTYDCAGSGYLRDMFCTTFTWRDDDANPWPDSGSTELNKACIG